MVALVDTGDWRWGWLGNKKPSHLLLLFPHAQQLLTTTTTSNPTFLCRRVRMLGASAGPRRGVSLGGVHHQQGRLGPRTPLAAMSVWHEIAHTPPAAVDAGVAMVGVAGAAE
eukprot:1159208-Pelagomonas_calceolata.AAC.19